MVINQTISIGILKNDLIYIILEKNKEKQELSFGIGGGKGQNHA